MKGKQLEFFADFYDTLEVGWWLDIILSDLISKDPKKTYVFYSKKSNQSIMGFIPFESTGVDVYYVNDNMYLDGTRILLKNNS